MKTLLLLLLQPSSFAGYAVLAGVIPQLIAAPASITLWGAALAAAGAILRSEAAHV
jgi:hypothetical protein